MSPAELVGHVKMRFVPERVIVICVDGNAKLNTVPLFQVPPLIVVPYRVFPDITNLLAYGRAPSVPQKLCSVENTVPSVLRAKSVPLPEAPC